MTVEEFFTLFQNELSENKNLQKYYKFLNDPIRFEFRKAYFCQRLQYIIDNIDSNARIWDCGCGYGTTGIFLSLNGIKSEGTTLEFYFKEIPTRLDFWKKYGDISNFSFDYKNVFDGVAANSFDTIILQDTLHHLEPLDTSIAIFNNALSPKGNIILIEENGSNIIQNLKLIKQRGFKKVKEIYDEKLQKTILLGDENIRSLAKWRKAFKKRNFDVLDAKTQYIRLYPPSFFKTGTISEILQKEQLLWQRNAFLKHYFYFGLNFIVQKV
jgi:SAM-dependent methyltransferase